ncbi:hypothetical protein PQJ75_28195 [Rhodoplanes sp. TEM]|uniref:Uncharacterized protein n=1 Tax=Rhodoplanes tepidamans TaxID=200616 RepID=A0ABT5J3E7_RHOTP|nr:MULTISPECIES: hypothetical protein [Rhodoplanes]MDC7784187.1 hypothetical protein [Rhodoplanes tepidamans]MDC7987633.1 hypothetical protein [Rhodoplanes sp. TEM]MDQ0356715.1 hypothetical protein [Rhodoplanes tepidamans]
MTETGRNFILFVLIGLLALPSGLCSAFFTIGGVGLLFEKDPVGQSLSVVFLGGALIGWIFCVLVLFGARRLRRAAGEPGRQGSGDPGGPSGAP